MIFFYLRICLNAKKNLWAFSITARLCAVLVLLAKMGPHKIMFANAYINHEYKIAAAT